MARQGVPPNDKRFVLRYATPPYAIKVERLTHFCALEDGEWSLPISDVERVYCVQDVTTGKMYRMSWDIMGYLTMYPLDGSGDVLVREGREHRDRA